MPGVALHRWLAALEWQFLHVYSELWPTNLLRDFGNFLR